MWLLSFLPSWLVYAAFFASVIGLIASFVFQYIPFVGKYALPIQALCSFVLLVSVWLAGGISNEEAWQAKVNELQAKVAAAEIKSAKVNTKIVEKVVTKLQVVKDNTNANIKVIEKIVTLHDSKCELSNAAIVLHDSASQNAVPPSAGDIDAGASDVKASDLLTTVTENYGQYYELREVVKGWQDWYKEQKSIYDAVK